jgi:hypothetical protein
LWPIGERWRPPLGARQLVNLEDYLSKLGNVALAGLLVVAALGTANTGFAATTPVKPAAAATTAKPAATKPAPAAAAATGLVCQVTPSGKSVHIQAVNKGTAEVAAGTSFTFTIIGPTKKTTETVKLKAALAPGAAVDVTKSIPAKNVTGCSPTS